MSRLWGEGSFHAHYLSGYRLLLCVSSNRKRTLTTSHEVVGLEVNADDSTGTLFAAAGAAVLRQPSFL